jgi:hypothetical protein
MRIYNLDSDEKVNRVTLYLTPDEAQELKHALELIISDCKKYDHKHIPDSEYKREITVCIYKKDNLSSFNERSRKLILNDE